MNGVTPDLAEAFPRRMRAEVRATLAVLPAATLPPASPFRVLLAGEIVTIPYRIYAPEPPPGRLEELPPVQRTVVDCLYTRHHDGWVRQRHAERIVGRVEAWVAPFVVQLIGKYVEEILLAIHHALVPALTDPGSAVSAVYGMFAAENPRFVALTRQRATSYWDCYHRNRYPAFTHYPGSLLTTALKAAAASALDHGTRP